VKWLVTDSLYNPEAFTWGHLDSWSHYLREYGETVDTYSRSLPTNEGKTFGKVDVLFALDYYRDAVYWGAAKVKIAQVAAICDPMPWEVLNPDGSPAYDLVVSSLRWMVDESLRAGTDARHMPLAFDARAIVAGMGVKRDVDTLFVGTLGGNHRKRTDLVTRMSAEGRLTILPPTFGRAYFAALASAKRVLNVHAEWARGETNNMRMYEAAGMGAVPIDEDGRVQIMPDIVWAKHRYEHRIPTMVAWAKELMERKK